MCEELCAPVDELQPTLRPFRTDAHAPFLVLPQERERASDLHNDGDDADPDSDHR